jgi:tetratricopeptide (TPR) repeat protein
MKNFLCLFIVGLLLISCKAKKLRKQAYQFEQLGAFEQASQYYFKSLEIDNDNVDAIVGYKKNTQIVLDQIHEGFYEAYKNGDYKSAIYLYEEAEKLTQKASRFRIKLQKLNDYNVYYNEALSGYLEQQYKKGKQYLSLHNYNSAKTIFSEIIHFNEIFKDSKKQLEIATFEPIYLNGIKYLENNSNRKAYYEFEAILNKTDYKDALELQREALEKAIIKIAVSPSSLSRGYNIQKQEFKQFFVAKLNDIPSPFFKVIEITDLKPHQPLDTQLELAKRRGAKALFAITINDISFRKGPLKKETYKAYKKKETPYKDQEGKTRIKTEYFKTTATLFSNAEQASIKLEYKLISTLDKSILVSKVVNDRITDQIKYMYYKGDQKQLIPGYWKYQTKEDSSDKIRDNSYENRKLQALLNARRNLAPPSVLYDKLLNIMSNRINQPIANYDAN